MKWSYNGNVFGGTVFGDNPWDFIKNLEFNTSAFFRGGHYCIIFDKKGDRVKRETLKNILSKRPSGYTTIDSAKNLVFHKVIELLKLANCLYKIVLLFHERVLEIIPMRVIANHWETRIMVEVFISIHRVWIESIMMASVIFWRNFDASYAKVQRNIVFRPSTRRIVSGICSAFDEKRSTNFCCVVGLNGCKDYDWRWGTWTRMYSHEYYLSDH